MVDEELLKEIEESNNTWAEIHKQQAIREQKDRRIISKFCASNNAADILHTLELLQKYEGMSKHDKEIVSEFQQSYPHNLTLDKIQKYMDVTEIYGDYLEAGGYDYE